MERGEAHPIQAHPIWTEEGQTEQSQTERLEARRRSYAEYITGLAGMAPDIGMGREIAAALTAIPRERFVGPTPWKILSSSGHWQTVSDDPAALYQDVVVSLGRGWGLNNGQPSLHAMCLAALAPQKGEHVVHVGAGTGYYTAVLSALVGETGQVDAYEIEPELARQAAANLAEFSQVMVHGWSGAEGPLPELRCALCERRRSRTVGGLAGCAATRGSAAVSPGAARRCWWDAAGDQEGRRLVPCPVPVRGAVRSLRRSPGRTGGAETGGSVSHGKLEPGEVLIPERPAG